MSVIAELRGLQALDRLVGFQLQLTTLHATQAAREALAERNTTPAKVTALLFILDNPGCDQTSLGKFMRVGRSGTMKLLNTMEARGHVERRSGRDLRSNGVYLTPAGERFLDEALRLIEESDREITAQLSRAEQDLLLTLLAKLRNSSGN